MMCSRDATLPQPREMDSDPRQARSAPHFSIECCQKTSTLYTKVPAPNIRLFLADLGSFFGVCIICLRGLKLRVSTLLRHTMVHAHCNPSITSLTLLHSSQILGFKPCCDNRVQRNFMHRSPHAARVSGFSVIF